MIITNDTKLDFDDILLVPQRSPNASRSNVNLRKKYKFFHSFREWDGIPIMAANMDTTGTFAMAKSLWGHDMITCLDKHYDKYDVTNFFLDVHESELVELINCSWTTIGMNEKELNDLIMVSGAIGHDPNICIDIANGYTEKFVDWCVKVRENFPHSIIMAGNVCTPEMVQELILHGMVDIVKIGIGPGSACTTRLKTGVGYPQLSAIIECSQVAHGLKSGERKMGLICADGGCRTPSDICKAFAAGADFVMLGGMLAGTDECEGEWEYTTVRKSDGKEFPNGPELDSPMNKWDKKKKSLLFYGMSSEAAQNKHNGGMADYKASEGRIKKVKYKGPVENIISDIEGGLRSCCAYVGSTCLKDLPKCARAVKVNRTHFDKNI